MINFYIAAFLADLALGVVLLSLPLLPLPHHAQRIERGYIELQHQPVNQVDAGIHARFVALVKELEHQVYVTHRSPFLVVIFHFCYFFTNTTQNGISIICCIEYFTYRIVK